MTRSPRAALILACVISAVVLIFTFLGPIKDFVITSGNHLYPYPGQDLILDYSLGWLWAIVLFFVVLLVPLSRLHRGALLRIWALKVFVSLGLGLAYEYQYGLDIDGYFRNVVAPDFVFSGFGFREGTVNIWQLVWLHNRLIPNSYHASKVGFAFIGLWACYLFYRAAVVLLRKEDIRVFYAISLFPSILFWSSTLGKDPIMLFGMSLYAYGVIGWFNRRRWREVACVVIGCLVVSLIRIWYLPIMMIPLAVLNLRLSRDIMTKTFLGLAILAILALSFWGLADIMNIETTNDAFEARSYAAHSFSGGGSSFDIPAFNDIEGIIRYAPIGVFTALFRPLPFEIDGIAGLLAGFENLFLLILLIMAIKRTKVRELLQPFVLWDITIVLIWAAFYGMVARNFGSLARYKLQILPFLFGLLIYLGRNRLTERTKMSNMYNAVAKESA